MARNRGSIQREISQYPNAYFGCSEILEWTGGSTAPILEDVARLIREIEPERVMMGSDFPWYDLHRAIELVERLPMLSEQQKEGIIGPNAVDILKI
jgi:predicted TIM-barrel fold metal-dependent hydrolase